MTVSTKLEGVAIGLLMGFENGQPLVVYAQNPDAAARAAKSLVQLSTEQVGSQVALLFVEGDPSAPMVVGPVLDTPLVDRGAVIVDGKVQKIMAEDRVELRCGKASIILEASGHITIRGSDLTSQASGINAVRGASVTLN
ncbi:MAG: DUF6484 domain-containing protein [Paracoccaceae bacterium]|nr:DUF6484 domain-containing protein [Paracoccaceae bacterium]